MVDVISKATGSTMGMTMAYAYLRTSSEGQDTVMSPSRQRHYIVEYAKKMNIFVLEFFQEVASGFDTTKRPEFLRMIAMAVDPATDANAIIFHDLSRFSRSDVDPHQFVDMLLEHDIVVHSVRDGRSDDIQARRAWKHKFATNSDYIEDLSLVTMEGLLTSVRNGNYPFRPPYGYKRFYYPEKQEMPEKDYEDERSGKRSGEEKTIYRPRIEPDPETSQVVIEAFKRKENGESSMAIINDFNSRGISSPSGGLWATSSLLSMLKNDVYKGTATAGKTSRSKFILHRKQHETAVLEDSHEPLISKETFDAVQKRIAENTRPRQSSPRCSTSPNPLSDRVKCGHCIEKGHLNNMTLMNQGSHKKLVCSGKKKRGADFCNKKNIPLIEFLEQVTTELLERILTKEVLTKQLQTLKEEIPERVKAEMSQIKEVEKAFLQTQKQRKNLTAAIADYDADNQGPGFMELIKKLEAVDLRYKELEDKKASASRDTQERIDYLSDPERIIATAMDLRTFLDPSDPSAGREFLRAFIQEVRVFDDRDHIITYTLPLPQPKGPDDEPVSLETTQNQKILLEHAAPSPMGRGGSLVLGVALLAAAPGAGGLVGVFLARGSDGCSGCNSCRRR
ncbi:MAG: recombinase family protein, partial [Chloroflexi bacterium]|nr:recombinase family protein [Chloroflexota bacterium]